MTGPAQESPFIIQPEDFARSLQNSTDNTDIRIVDLSSEENFLNAHIPGAIHLPFKSLMLGQAPAPGKLPNLAQLEEVFQFLGLSENTHFIVCDDEGGGWAGRFIWTLDVIGHKHYSYIDGGMIAWNAANLPTESGKNNQTTQSKTTPSITINRNPIADLDTILAGLGENLFTVWDARSPQEYAGTRVVSAKGGHIPGAINAEWTSLMDSENGKRIKPNARELLASIGIDGTLPIITHCQSHHRSGFTYLLGKHLGFDIKAYDGSWSEWGNHPDTPVEV